jgi:hypothetical protein
MEALRIVIGEFFDDQVTFKPIIISKLTEWLRLLNPNELAEFMTELTNIAEQIARGDKSVNDLYLFLSEWHETALINQEADVLDDIMEAELELNAGGGKEWTIIKKEIGL